MIKYNNNTINKLATDATVNKMYYGSNVAYIAPPLVEPSYKATIITTTDDVIHVSDNGSDVLTRAEISGAVTSLDSIKKITVGECVTTIGDRGFYKMNNCLIIDLPNTITSVGQQGIYYDNKLTAIYFRSITPPQLDYSVGFYNTNNCPIYVPADSVNAYKTANVWSNVASRIQAIPS